MKKILSLVLVLALVLGSFSFTFAASNDVTADVEDDAVKAAVERLVAFGIVNGMDDGKYHPEEMVTREQFAKIVVEALGLGTAADAAKGSTQFTDVATDRWSVGYINTAVGQGILKGYPDGTFQPAKEVSYAEALTMLVRALGYKDEFLTGSWPANYIAKAADLDVTDDVKVSPSGAADRGSVAVMVNNTLDAKIIEQESFGDDNNWEESEITLLEDKLEVTKIKDAVVTATPKVDSGIDEDQLTYIDGEYTDKSGTKHTGVDATSDVVIEGLNIDTLLGLSLNIYENDDDEIVYVEESDEGYKVLYDVIDDGEDIEEDSITLINVDKEYEFAEDYTVYVDNEKVTEINKTGSDDELVSIVKDGKKVVYGRFVLDNKGNIAVADLQQFDGDEARIVKSVDGEEIIYNVTDADDEKSLDLADDDYDAYVIMDAQGNIMDPEDIEKDDIIYVNEKNVDGDDLEIASSGDVVVYVVVVRDVLEGAAESYDNDEIEIDGEAYDWTGHATATVSVDDDDEYVMVPSSGDLDELDDITDEEADVIALRDLVGDIRHIRTDVDSSSSELYGVITDTKTDYSDVVVKILNYDEDEVEYEFDLDDIYGYGTGADENAVKRGDIVKYTLNSDSEIDMIAFIGRVESPEDPEHVFDNIDDVDAYVDGTTTLVTPIASTLEDDMDVDYGTIDDDYEEDSIQIREAKAAVNSGDDYVVDDKVVVLDLTASVDGSSVDYGDAEYVDYAGLVDKSDTADVIYVLDDNGAIVFMAFMSNFDANDDEQAGYVVDSRKKDGDYVLEMVLPGSDDIVKYTVDDRDGITPEDESIAIFEVGSDGDIDLLSKPSDYTTVTGMVYEVNSRYVTILKDDGTTVTHKVDNDCVYYEEDDEAGFSDLDENQTMVTVAIKNAKIEVAKIYDIEIDDKGTDDNKSDDTFDTSDGDTKAFLDKVSKGALSWWKDQGFED